jgi:hypothetical protein
MEAACRVIKTNSGSCRSEWDAISASVRNGTEWPPSESDDECMLHDKKRKKLPGNTTRASVEQEMARPRMAKSARIAELNLDTARIPEQPSTTMPGTVDKIIPSPHSNQPERAEIAIDGADHRYRDLRIENTLTDENGDDVRLKKGAHVEVTVTTKAMNHRK